MEKRAIEKQAKTVDQAIMDALAELGAGYEDVEVEILSQGGFLKKAKVRVTMKQEDKQETKTHIEYAERKEERPQVREEKPKQDDAVRPVREEKNEPAKERPAPASQKERAVGETPEKFVRTLEFTQKLMELLGNGCEAEGEETEKSFNINIKGGNLGQIIGKGGEVLNALQSLVSAIAISSANGEHKRVYVNAEDYKERRKETLVSLAMKKVEKVKTTGRYIKLEPMNSRDRAIVHSALQDVEGVRTYSTGKDPFRCLCIAPKKDEETNVQAEN